MHFCTEINSVDVFFVISGFLISTIIMGSLERNSFSFVEFYSRRIKRIFPALILVLSACLAFGWFALLADEYKQLGKHIAGGAGFISNFLFWNESGYFDNAAETKPLLHLWSLGIEEQFYIVWPLLLWVVWKKRFNLLTITLFVALISFALNIRQIRHDEIAAFYSPQTRFWELLIGSVLAYLTLHRQSLFPKLKHCIDGWLGKVIYAHAPEVNGKTLHNVQSLLGAFFILAGVLIITKERHFPGWWALLPTLGAVLIISAGVHAWFNRVVLSNGVLVWFGLISFPLYLWHWPLLSFARIMESDTPSRGIRLAAVVIAIVLAWLTYQFVERPVRLGRYGQAKTVGLIVLMTITASVGYLTYKENGLPFRGIVKEFHSYSDSIKVSDRKFECFGITHAYKKEEEWFCNLGDKSLPAAYFAYGDSHALSLLPALEIFAKENGVSIQFTGASGCPSLLGIQSMRGESDIEKNNCQKLNERIFDHVKKSKIKNVLLINRWNYYTGSEARPSELNLISRNPNGMVNKDTSTTDFVWAVKNTINRYQNIGVKVIFVADNPQQLFEPKDILRKGQAIESNYITYSVSYADHVKNQKFVNSILRGQSSNIINFDDILCNSSKCPLVLNHSFLYSDDDHLSIEGAKIVSHKLSSELKRLGS